MTTLLLLYIQPEDKLHVKLYNEAVYVSSLSKEVLEIAKISVSVKKSFLRK